MATPLAIIIGTIFGGRVYLSRMCVASPYANRTNETAKRSNINVYETAVRNN